MDDQPHFLDVIRDNLVASITGFITLATAIIGLVLLLQGNYYLGITVLGTLGVLALLFLLIYVALGKTPALIEGGKGVYRFQKYRSWALVGIGFIVGVSCTLFLFESSRSFVMTGFVTPTPTPTVPSSTPELTSSSTSVSTPEPTPSSTSVSTPPTTEIYTRTATASASSTFTPEPTNTQIPTSTALPQTPTTEPTDRPGPTAAPSATLLVTPPSQLPTRMPDDEVSKVKTVTGLGEEIILPYENIGLESYILDYLMSKQEDNYGVHFISLKTNEIVNQFLPLNDFKYAVKAQNKPEQVIMFSNGEEIVGNLNTTLEYPDGVYYDLSTANEVVLVSLAITDTSILDYETEDEVEWVLEILEPMKATYHVTNPRFVFQYTYFYNLGYSHRERVVETREFYLIDENEGKLLGNIKSCDEIRVEHNDHPASTAIVTIGSTVTKGSIEAVSTELNKGDTWWYFVANITDSNMLLAFNNGGKPVFALRKQ